MFPGTCSKIPKSGLWEDFFMFPGGGIQAQARMWTGLVSPEISKPEIMNAYGA